MAVDPTALPQPAVVIRPMDRGDLPAVMRNETRAYAFPWTEGNFRDCMASGYGCWVLEARAPSGPTVVGHGVVSTGAGEGHILNVCVRREDQGRGLGRRLLMHLVEQARADGVLLLFLEVRRSNRVARELYRSAGFNEVGTRPGYYPAFTGREDAEVLALQLDDGAPLEDRSGPPGSGARLRREP